MHSHVSTAPAAQTQQQGGCWCTGCLGSWCNAGCDDDALVGS
jgi:hypothetical protein